MATTVRMRQDISGLRDGEPWPRRGETVDLPDGEALDMIAASIAEAEPE